MKTPFGRMIFPRKALLFAENAAHETRCLRAATLSGRLSADAGCRKNPHNNQNPTMNLVSDNEQRNNRLRLRKP
jgi:hypothetical protein